MEYQFLKSRFILYLVTAAGLLSTRTLGQTLDSLNGYHSYVIQMHVKVRGSFQSDPDLAFTNNSTFPNKLVNHMRETGMNMPRFLKAVMWGTELDVQANVTFAYSSSKATDSLLLMLATISQNQTFPYVMKSMQLISDEYIPEVIFTSPHTCADEFRRIYRISALGFSACTTVDLLDKRSTTLEKCMESFCGELNSNVVEYEPQRCHLKRCTTLTYISNPQENQIDSFTKVVAGCGSSSPCENGGTCFRLDPNSIYRKCHCQDGFRGSRCQKIAIFDGGPFSYRFSFIITSESWKKGFGSHGSRDFNSLSEKVREPIAEGFERLARDDYDVPSGVVFSFSEHVMGVETNLTVTFPAYQVPEVLYRAMNAIASSYVGVEFQATSPIYLGLVEGFVPPTTFQDTTERTTPFPSTEMSTLKSTTAAGVRPSLDGWVSTTGWVLPLSTNTMVSTLEREEATTIPELFPCDEDPCQNGATCRDTDISTFRCICRSGYYGKTCNFVKGSYKYTLRFRITSLTFNSNLLRTDSGAYQQLSRPLKTTILREYAKIAEPEDVPIDASFAFTSGSVVADISPTYVSPQNPGKIKAILDNIINSAAFPEEVNPPAAELTTIPNLFKCNFEVIDLCGMILEQVGTGLPWVRHTGPTPLAGTGPANASSGSYYMYIDTRNINEYTFSDFLLTPQLEYTGQVCVMFKYHMIGSNVGNLFLLLRDEFGSTEYVWGNGNVMTNGWKSLIIRVNITERTQQFALQAAPLAGGFGDIAIDDFIVDLNMSACTFREQCAPYQNGPHTDECLRVLWLERCKEDAPGNPLVDSAIKEFLNQYTLEEGRGFIGRWATKANKGEEPWLTRCYGTEYIRLVGTSLPRSGRVEVFRDGAWGTVCDDNFDEADAQVICRQRGFIGGEGRTDAFYGPGRVSMPIWLSGLECTGQEQNLYQCAQENQHGWTCYHNEDAGVICQEAITSLLSDVGGDIIPRSHTDSTEGAIFITDTTKVISKAGKVVRWEYWSILPNITFYLQIWRLLSLTMSGERYVLVNQTQVTSLFGSENQTMYLNEHEQIDVLNGDVLGIYFPDQNPIPWSSQSCYSSNEQVRYYYDPEIVGVGDRFSFKLAPLAWRPCRSYSLKAIIEHHDETTLEPPTTTEIPILEAPQNVSYWCSFEDYQQCNMTSVPGPAGLSWTQHSGPTDSLGTGPEHANTGEWYMYIEASFHPEGSIASLSFDVSDMDGDMCLSFYYHMYGAGIGKLSLLDSSGSELWMRQGPTGDRWVLVQHQIFATGLATYTFSATLGRTVQGDIAIDDFTITAGICVPPSTTSTPKPTLPLTTPRPGGAVPELLNLFVSNDGQDLPTCGSQREPCKTLSNAIKQEAVRKIIRVVSSSAGNNYDIDLSLLPRKTLVLRINGVMIDGALPKIYVVGSPHTQLTELSFSNLRMHGDIEVPNCNAARSLKVNFIESIIGGSLDSGVIAVGSCGDLVLAIEKSRLDGYLFEYTVYGSSDVKISDSVIAGNYSHWNGTSWSSSGISGNYLKRNGKHVLKIENSQFENLGQDLDIDKPGGALTVIIEKDSSSLKMLVFNCTFTSNHRAIDMSLKGSTVAEITKSRFLNNHALGSGGALRFTPTLQSGFGSLSRVSKAKLYIQDCDFINNTAVTSEVYTEGDVYYQTRSPGSGGAIYVFLTVPSPLPQDGLVSISHCTFSGNTASVHGGTIYNNPGISLQLLHSTVSNRVSYINPNFGAILYSLCNMTISNTIMDIAYSDGSTPIVSYQASDPTNSRLLAKGLNMTCPPGFWVEQLNTSSFAGAGGIETLQLYCRACTDEYYSLQLSSVAVDETIAYIDNPVNCMRCPYGAKCAKGIWNKQGFWGSAQTSVVSMYQCPEDYCENDFSLSPVAFDSCAENRAGTLCGRCTKGYSESMFGIACIPDEDCGFKNWYIVLFLVLYGIFYLLFFMFEQDWARFVRWISVQLRRKDSAADKEEIAEAADLGEAGYFQSFMYFIQTSDLLKVEIVIEKDEIYQYLHRPQDLIPDWLVDGFKKVLNFDILFFQGKTCIFPGITPVLKVAMKFSFVLYLFSIIFFLYLVSGFCCFWMPNSKRPRIGQISMNARMLGTIVALALYTYQAIAEDAFLLLNCSTVDGKSVLYLDGNVSCLQDWQWAVIILVCVYVIPFFIILSFGPKLLQKRQISLGFFFSSMLFPLFLAPVIILIYFGCLKREPSPAEEDTEDDDKVRCCGDKEESREGIAGAMIGPYREDILNGLCWEGVINFRRMILVVCFTFINDRLLKQMAMSFVCFIVLIIHIKAKPFKQKFSNYAESASLGMLLIISGTNLVKASFYHSQTIPRGGNYLVIVIYEWLEALCLGVLPILLLGMMFAAMVIKTASRLIQRSKEDKEKSDPPDESDSAEFMNEKVKLAGSMQRKAYDPFTGFDESARDFPFVSRPKYLPKMNNMSNNNSSVSNDWDMNRKSDNRLPRIRFDDDTFDYQDPPSLGSDAKARYDSPGLRNYQYNKWK